MFIFFFPHLEDVFFQNLLELKGQGIIGHLRLTRTIVQEHIFLALLLYHMMVYGSVFMASLFVQFGATNKCLIECLKEIK